MYRLSFVILLLTIGSMVWGQSPHGSDFVIDCATCHDPNGWAISIDTFLFDHDTTGFLLEGVHEEIDCRSCHTTLVFAEAVGDCASCHEDLHSMSVGNDCARCHTSQSWLVDNIPELHEQNGFPLFGAHGMLSCNECHISETNLRFDRIGNDCINCHQEDFNQAKEPDHIAGEFSTNCIECHDPNHMEWTGTGILHDFFPLELGHDIQDCNQCHQPGTYEGLSPDCVNCHLTDFENTSNPDHQTSGFTQDCASCHTLEPGWKPAKVEDHDELYFPIYSGEHEGEWNDCMDCHTDPGNYAVFRCTNCHERNETDDEHDDVSGYVYEDNACFACHPTGSEEGSFDHNTTDFPLTGAHIDVSCLECHSDGYAGTSTACVDCHTMDFNGTVNPDHQELNLSMDCASCHTTDPAWNPATFDVHNDFYPLNGAHAEIANECIACHDGDYQNTPNICAGCHQEEYDNTTDPDHVSAQFSTDCATCHLEDAWVPSAFDHDGQYFPIYSGSHEGEWMECLDCHTQPGDYSIFTCIGCHVNPETDNEHEGVGGYSYEDNACLACHPTGDSDDVFDHNLTAFPLTGAHMDTECLQCHSEGYEGTPTRCESCHFEDFMASTNPSHGELLLSQNCASCHTTDPGWMPATFDIHDNYYALVGRHADIANDCAQCHNGDYTSTPFTCVGCHQEEYDETSNPNHLTVDFGTDCMTCHDEHGWTPATFDHDGQYFPIYSGSHEGEWSACVDCHTVAGDYSQVSCTVCHVNPETDNEHEGVGGYSYEDNACLACHPTGESDDVFDHNLTAFPLTGAHIDAECLQCHTDGYAGTSTACVDCHTQDFNATVNPDHQELNLSSDCASCHNTDPGWSPATFDVHNDYYALNGAHAIIANECIQCHNGDYTNTPNTCAGCHQEDYDNTTDPDHQAAQFSNDCASCHAEDAWVPATFDHDAQYFPIYSGSHEGEWSECTDCHIQPGDYSVFSCIVCHTDPGTSDEHDDVSGYVYEDNACLVCHPTGEEEVFDHNTTSFALTGAHDGTSCLSCHGDGFVGTPTDCNRCHLDQFRSSTNPDHESLSFSEDCASCHTTEFGWNIHSFQGHDNFFALTGAHASIAQNCTECHVSGDYNNTPNTCAGCHTEDYNATTNPDHQAAGFPLDCAQCHTDGAWVPSTFDHNTIYPLNGAHAEIANNCTQCHIGGDYNNTPTTCAGCHQGDFDVTTNPDHQAAGFSTNCTECHNEGAWSPSTFDHDGFYPLTGAHELIATNCIQCHTTGDYSTTPNTCAGCHTEDYNSTTNPDHQAAGFPLDCAQCHTDGAWVPSTFDHNTIYPLNGAHALIENNCTQCHIGGDYNNTPTTCVGCHLNEYNNTNDPDHALAQFPTTCNDCHSESAWEPSTFDHDGMYFPIYSGRHQGEWTSCTECHINSSDYSIFSCIDCHEHSDRTQVDDDHSEVNNYIYQSSACFSCHPNGSD